MKIKRITSGVKLMFFTLTLYSQSITDLVNDTSLNFHQIQKKIHQDKKYFENATEKEMKFYKRWEWFWSTRVDEKGSFKEADKAMQRFLKEREKQKDKKNDHKLVSTNKVVVQRTWESRGPWNYTLEPKGTIGRVQVVWADPDIDGTILIGTHGNGLWKTTNDGVTWTRLNPDIPGGVTSIAVDPTDKNKIYITTGISTAGFEKKHYATGIWKSYDAGQTWSQRGADVSMTYTRQILVDKNAPYRVFTLSEDKLYRSTNYGSTWNVVLTAGPGQMFRELKQNPNTPGYFYVAGDNTFFISSDTGVTWTDKGRSVWSNTTWRFTVDVSEDNTLYGYLFDYDGKKTEDRRILYSSPTNINWTKKYTNFPDCDIYLDLCCKALNDGVFYVGSKYCRKFVFDGVNFGSGLSVDGLHVDVRSMSFPKGDASVAYIATDGGVSKNTDADGRNFTQINGNIALNECYDVGIHESDRNALIVGAHDNGTMYQYNSMAWSYNSWGDGGMCSFDPVNKNRFQYTVNGKLWIKESNGSMNPSNLADDDDFYNVPYAVAPTSSNIVYGPVYGSSGAEIRKSYDYGLTFGSPVPIGAWGNITQLAVNEFNSGTVYAATWPTWGTSNKTSNIRRSIAGGTWFDLNNGLKHRSSPITQIVCDRTNKNKAWVTFGSNNSAIYVLMGTGSSRDYWYDISTNLPDMPINTVAYDDVNDVLYVGTDVGVYAKKDGESIWYEFNLGLPMLVITRLYINHNSGELVASTYGGGVWSCNVGNQAAKNASVKTEINEVSEIFMSKHNIIELKIYPNPISESSTIEVSGNLWPETMVNVFELNGKLVKQLTIKNGKCSINKSTLHKGTYVLSIKQGGKTYVNKKVVVL